jgi:O-antigen ligase
MTKHSTRMQPDILVCIFFACIAFCYNYRENLSPDRFLFVIQLCIFWFVLRILVHFFPILKTGLPYLILLAGLVEAIWGLGQLYGYFPSKHPLFKTTGSFLNPGPYGGFISLIFPLSLHYWLYYKQKNKFLSCFALLTGMVCFMVFPATLSRTAWIAAILGCLFVLLFDTRLSIRLRAFRQRRKRWFILGITILCITIVGSFYGTYLLKKDSADGRFFMWKITTLAIKESPVKGKGLGGFPAAYAKAQIEYFKSERANETEKLVAGSPEYAFNEYLQIFLEQGLPGILLFLLLSFLIIKEGIRNKQVGATGSFVTLLVFAFASYPYQLWQFPIVWVLLGTICTAGSGSKKARTYHYGSKKTVLSVLLLGTLCFVSVICSSRQKVFFQAKKEWKKLQPLYTVKAYESVTDDYAALYPVLNYEPKFVFEYGIVLNAAGQRGKADSILSRGLKMSCDPMFYNVKGRNYHEMGKYSESEECYRNSLYLLPERIYPYYLLTKLYADPANYQPVKMQEAAVAVLEKEPKIHSPAIEEMRAEVKTILKEKGMIL